MGGQSFIGQQQANRFVRGELIMGRAFMIIDSSPISTVDLLTTARTEMEARRQLIGFAGDQLAGVGHFGP